MQNGRTCFNILHNKYILNLNGTDRLQGRRCYGDWPIYMYMTVTGFRTNLRTTVNQTVRLLVTS